MADQRLLRLSAVMVLVGDVLVTMVVLFLHPGGGATMQATFAAYAASGDWATIHLGQFLGMALILAGLFVLYLALDVPEGPPHWVGLFGAISAGVALALTGVVFAVDGVALKQAVDAWVTAPASGQAARFASAQAVRWLEWGATSYQDFTIGLALVLLGTMIVWTARISRPIGYLMGLSGLAFIVVSWLVGTNGFTPADTIPTQAAYTLLVVSMIWQLVVAWRGESIQAAIG